MKNLSSWVLCFALLILAGCVAPSTGIKTPMTARPPEVDALPSHNGAIFQAGRNEHPLFEDRHARNVGDILTVNIAEAVSANQSDSKSASHAGSMNASTPSITGAGGNKLIGYNVTQASNGALADKSANAGANTFTGTIAVTVVEVLPNGNLLVGGEKQIAINQNSGFIRLSGVVDPSTIVSSSTGFIVQSTQLADVHLEYKDSNNNIDTSQIMGMLGRAFLSVLPF